MTTENIYATPGADVEPEQPRVHFAGFWIRFAATLIDSLWLMALTFWLGWMVYGPVYFQSESLMLGGADLVISYLLPFVLTLLFWHFRAATPGKALLGLRIVDAKTLGKAPAGRLCLRYLGYYLSALALMLGFVWVGIDARKQGLHDKLARTLVIKER